jgi:hypothetical protein
MTDTAKTFLTALIAVAGAAILALWLAEHAEAIQPHQPHPSQQHLAGQTVPVPQAVQASQPRG